MTGSDRTDDAGDLVDLALRQALHQADHRQPDESADPAELSREVHEVLETVNYRPERSPPPEVDEDPGFPLPDG